jgi:hypothetical protein
VRDDDMEKMKKKKESTEREVGEVQYKKKE